MGLALLEGRKLHKADRAFGDWCRGCGFDMHRNVRGDAMWLAENWNEVQNGCAPESHPTRIRQAHREGLIQVPEDLQSLTPEPTLRLPQRDAEKVSKVIHRATSGDQGADIAKKHVDALAKKHGVTVEALTEAAKQGAPDTFFRFTPTVQAQLDTFRISVKNLSGVYG